MLVNDDIQKLYWQIKQSDNVKVAAAAVPAVTVGKVSDRVVIINYIALAISCAIILRLVYINTFNHQFLNDQLNTRVLRTIKLTAMRGTITDRNSTPLAVSTPVDSIWVDPSELNDLTSAQVNQLAQIMEMPVADLIAKLNQKNKTFVYLKRALPPESAKAVLALGIEGIYSQQEYKRYYPDSDLTAHIVGFNNIDDHGAAGIEYADDKLLQGTDGSKQIVRDPKGHVVDNVGEVEPAQNGKQITLSVDNRIQYITYQALKAQVEKSAAKGGSAIVLDAKTGEVLSMVNMPTFNPNNLAGVTPDMLKNRAAVNAYDPGSIMKPLVIAKALDDKVVTPQTVFDTHPYSVGPKLIKDDHSYPQMTVTEIIQHSSDIGTSKIAMKYKPHDLWNYYREVGFGQKLDTGFPGETKGIMNDWKRWYPVDQALMSFGYGIAVSLFQMAHAYTIFTNNGCLLPVTFNKMDGTGDAKCTQVISPATAQTMRRILATVTEDGTGKSAQVSDYTVAGKTGTAQVLENGHYSNKKHISSFVGFAPVNNPRIIVAVMIDQPTQGGYYAAATAAPVFSNITQPTLQVLGVKPDKQ